ncbi:uncharacterized protein LOC119275379 isoform X2 [Triticum dicoccoides]|uniref:uncharacterized protein LOC119275379 isoform X2 n=1 Tax=Triticum dicoccoides TaxID=85692 RepID=UPI001890714A|nr:uncharacterized protein LOC119275379 isoform X2 [Triticum dicoccoides]
MPSSRAPPQQLGRWKSFDAGRRHQQPELLRCIAGGGIVAKQRPLRGAMYSSDGGGAAMERSTPTAELQWRCSTQARSCNGAPDTDGGAARRRRRSCIGALDAGGGAAMGLQVVGYGAAMERVGSRCCIAALAAGLVQRRRRLFGGSPLQ